MSDLPEERLNILSMLFTDTGIDFLGGYEVRAMNNARCKVKTFPMLFSCLNAGALHAELSHNYSTDAFLTCYASYTAIRGNSVTVYSDRGTQLVKAAEFFEDNNNNAVD